MLHEIHIQNYAVIDDLTVEFYSGLNLLSGETGSGKSIVVDALGLAIWRQGSGGYHPDGLRKSYGDGRFRSNVQPAWKRWLDELGIEETGEAEIIFAGWFNPTAAAGCW